MTIDIHGVCDPRFTAMRDAFALNFEKDLEIGAELAMTWRGQTVVDLWAGHKDVAGTLPWAKDTIVPVTSSTKVPAALMLLIAIDRGLLSLDERVAHYWPDFAQGDKGDVTVRDVLTHQAGTPGLDPPPSLETFYEWDAMVARIAAEPHWFSGQRQIAYHLATFGFIAGELVRRVDGRRPRQFFKEEIADKLDADFQIGLSDQADCARLASVTQDTWKAIRSEPGVRGKVYRTMPQLAPDDWRWLSAELPGINGVGSARALARIGAILAMGGELDGVRFLSPAPAAAAAQPQANGVCLIWGPITWGLGFGLHNPAFPAPTSTCMHWGGFGGSWVLMDPRAQVSFGYTPNNWRLDGSELLDKRLARFWHVLAELLPTL